MNARIYSLLLCFYPVELRRDFGAEMTQVFLEDLSENRCRAGAPGVARVWWRSIKELCRIALPVRVSRREIAVPLLGFLLQEFYLGLLWLLSPLDPRISPEFKSTALVFGLVTAATAFVALRIGDRAIPKPLNLVRSAS